MSPAERFDRCLEQVLRHEGGFVDHARDPGGVTNLGVTRATLEDWLGRSVSTEEMRALKPAAVRPIYRARYWDRVSGDAMPAGLDLEVFDCGVNQGIGRARIFLQRALGVVADGDIGPRTLLALRGCDPSTVVREMRRLREAHYRSLATFPDFGRGWMRRLAEVEAQALAWAGAAAAVEPG